MRALINSSLKLLIYALSFKSIDNVNYFVRKSGSITGIQTDKHWKYIMEVAGKLLPNTTQNKIIPKKLRKKIAVSWEFIVTMRTLGWEIILIHNNNVIQLGILEYKNYQNTVEKMDMNLAR